MTRATEFTDVGQGLAAGCLALGVHGVTSNTLALDRAFRHAWHDWSHAVGFRFVRADYHRNDIRQIIHKSERRRGSFLAAWRHGRWAEPYLRDGVDLDDASGLLPTWTGIPWEEWVKLAELFVSDFKDDEVRRVTEDDR